MSRIKLIIFSMAAFVVAKHAGKLAGSISAPGLVCILCIAELNISYNHRFIVLSLLQNCLSVYEQVCFWHPSFRLTFPWKSLAYLTCFWGVFSFLFFLACDFQISSTNRTPPSAWKGFHLASRKCLPYNSNSTAIDLNSIVNRRHATPTKRFLRKSGRRFPQMQVPNEHPGGKKVYFQVVQDKLIVSQRPGLNTGQFYRTAL